MGYTKAAYEIVVMCLTTDSPVDRTDFITESLEECPTDHDRIRLLTGVTMALAGVLDDVRRNLPDSWRFLDALRDMHVQRTLDVPEGD